jgi:hypothetical protein
METQFKSSAPSKNEKQVGQKEREGGVALIIDNRYKFMIDISLYCIGISIILSGIIIRVIWIMPLIISNTEYHKIINQKHALRGHAGSNHDPV